MSKRDDIGDRETINGALDWAARTPLKMGTKEFEDGIRSLLREGTETDAVSLARAICSTLQIRAYDSVLTIVAGKIEQAFAAQREAQREADAVIVESYWAGSGTIANAIRKGGA